jgi:hypothetical protein
MLPPVRPLRAKRFFDIAHALENPACTRHLPTGTRKVAVFKVERRGASESLDSVISLPILRELEIGDVNSLSVKTVRDCGIVPRSSERLRIEIIIHVLGDLHQTKLLPGLQA